jgi:serine/threonine-protein kinase
LETPSRWDEVERVFAAALEIPADRRESFLASAFAPDDALRAELRSLLAAHAQLNGDLPNAAFLAGLDAARAAALLGGVSGAARWEGRTLGAYRIVREAGRGGMATVYLAERADDVYRKQVAIKIVRQGLFGERNLRRFREERQILALLEHPHIARLLDGGISPDGLPYLVMEYVEGMRIDRYVEGRALAIEERLALFTQVCRAVQFAHGNLVVHRDLKPSNILVTTLGEVKLLDFGIAKLLTSEPEPGLTGTGVRPMTLEYASPEQVRGDAVTIACDIHALGVLLYELLTGVHPYRRTADTPAHALEQAILEKEPQRPSALLSGPRARRLRGDLDTIVLKAMRKEPERRYATADQLAADVRRYLDRMPITARPDTWPYRTQKFVRRHRAGVTTVAGFMVLLIAFSGVTTATAKRAEGERMKAAQTAAFLSDLFSISDPSIARGQTITARELLDRGAARIERELARQPDVRAQLLNSIGTAYSGLGLYAQARSLLEEAVVLRRGANNHATPELAESLHQLAYLLREQGEFAAAEPLFRESLGMRRALFSEGHASIVESLNGLAFLLRGRGDFAASEALYREALGLARAVRDPASRLLAESIQGLASALFGLGKHQEAEPLYREAVTLQLQLLGADHPSTMAVRYNQARNYQYLGDFDAAEPYYRDMLEQDPRIFGANHPMVAVGLTGYGEFLLERGDASRAESYFRRALTIQRAALPPESERTAATLVGLGRVLLADNKPNEAERLLREALAIREKKLVASHWQLAEARSVLGACLSLGGRFAEAEPLLLAGYDTLRTRRHASDPTLKRALEAVVAHFTRIGLDEVAARYRSQITQPGQRSPTGAVRQRS